MIKFAEWIADGIKVVKSREELVESGCWVVPFPVERGPAEPPGGMGSCWCVAPRITPSASRPPLLGKKGSPAVKSGEELFTSKFKNFWYRVC